MISKIKKPVSILLAVLMVISLFVAVPITASAAATYTVTWKNWNGTVLETDENVAEGATPTYDGETPVRPEDMNATYTFSAWDDGTTTYLIGEEFPPVTGDVTYKAEYTADIKNSLQVTPSPSAATSA